jgi:glycosyltransferase involved in cell wall biosynthesis
MLTVILSNYNHARFLPHALNALFAQSRPADEIILIDDASTDGSVAVIEAHLSRHPNTRLVRNPKNLGVIANLNRGLEMAHGNQVYFAAADDIAYPTLFEKSIALLDRYPRAALCSSRCDIIDGDGAHPRAMAAPMPRSTPGYIEPSEVAYQLVRDDSWFTGPTTMWHREILCAIGGFPEELGALTDGYISRHLALKYGACFLPEVLAAWRRIPGGMAWSQTMGTDAEQLTHLVERKMAKAGDVFPPGYAQRWKGRYLFGVRRFALVQERHTARSHGPMRWVVAAATEMFLTMWLFMKLRPFDFAAVMQRHLQHVVRR